MQSLKNVKDFIHGVHLVQELNEDDFGRRLQLYEEIMHQTNAVQISSIILRVVMKLFFAKWQSR